MSPLGQTLSNDFDIPGKTPVTSYLSFHLQRIY